MESYKSTSTEEDDDDDTLHNIKEIVNDPPVESPDSSPNSSPSRRKELKRLKNLMTKTAKEAGDDDATATSDAKSYTSAKSSMSSTTAKSSMSRRAAMRAARRSIDSAKNEIIKPPHSDNSPARKSHPQQSRDNKSQRRRSQDPPGTTTNVVVPSVQMIRSITPKKHRRDLTPVVPISTLTKAIIPIQAMVRSYLAKNHAENRMLNIIIVQSVIRRWQCLQYYKAVQCTALEIMASIDEEEQLESSATKIQSAWRGYLSSEYYMFVLSDVIVCQSVARRYIAMGDYEDTLIRRDAAIAIQKTFRCFNSMLNYHMTVADIITVQSIVRKWSAVRKLQHAVADIIMVQSVVRTWSAVRKLRHEQSVLTIQCATRQLFARKELLEMKWVHHTTNIAAIKIQAAFLGYRDRMDYLLMISDCITMQCAIRTMLAKKRLDELRQYAAATTIRAVYLNYTTRKKMKQYSAASKIRAVYLGYMDRTNYIFTVADIITIQKVIRGFQTRVAFSTIRRSVIKIQAVVRMYQFHQAREKAVTMIQTAYRGFVDYENYVVHLASAIQCQASIRQFLSRVERTKRVDSITKIQACWRSYQAQTEYACISVSAMDIQTAFRRYLVERRLEETYVQRVMIEAVNVMVEQCNASTVIQNWWRNNLIMKETKTTAATVIQSCFRTYRAEMQFLYELISIIRLQAFARGYFARRQLRQLVDAKRVEHEDQIMLVKEASAIIIQKTFRGYKQFVKFVITQYFIVKIQASGRAYIARRHYLLSRREERLRAIERNASRNRSILAAKFGTPRSNKLSVRSSFFFPLNTSKRKSLAYDSYSKREKKAALVIERFFITIKAEIDVEISRMEHDKKKGRRHHRQSNRIRIESAHEGMDITLKGSSSSRLSSRPSDISSLSEPMSQSVQSSMGTGGTNRTRRRTEMASCSSLREERGYLSFGGHSHQDRSSSPVPSFQSDTGSQQRTPPRQLVVQTSDPILSQRTPPKQMPKQGYANQPAYYQQHNPAYAQSPRYNGNFQQQHPAYNQSPRRYYGNEQPNPAYAPSPRRYANNQQNLTPPYAPYSASAAPPHSGIQSLQQSNSFGQHQQQAPQQQQAHQSYPYLYVPQSIPNQQRPQHHNNNKPRLSISTGSQLSGSSSPMRPGQQQQQPNHCHLQQRPMPQSQASPMQARYQRNGL